MRKRLAVFISGAGSNLEAIIKADIAVDLVISNKPDAGGIQKAQQAGIPALVVDHQLFPTREAFETAIRKHLDDHTIECIALAGFMRRLTPDFVGHYIGNIINLHPSLLPRYPGLHTHRKVLENQDTEHGISIHFVNALLDGGPLILQKRLTVSPTETETSLKERIQALEHLYYPAVVKLLSENRLQLFPDGSVKII